MIRWKLESGIDLTRELVLAGGLFAEDEEEQEMVFRFAIDRINADPTILPKSTLVAQVEKIAREDSFHADKKGLFTRFFRLNRTILLVVLIKKRVYSVP